MELVIRPALFFYAIPVTGVGVGTAIITATTEDGSYKATCTVTVKKAGTVPSGGDGGGESFPILWAIPSYFEQFSE